jgi:hypothetical protein
MVKTNADKIVPLLNSRLACPAYSFSKNARCHELIAYTRYAKKNVAKSGNHDIHTRRRQMGKQAVGNFRWMLLIFFIPPNPSAGFSLPSPTL